MFHLYYVQSLRAALAQLLKNWICDGKIADLILRVNESWHKVPNP